MITALTLHNWKSFDKGTLLIDQITFLIGTNASGKSNIVDALIFLSRLSAGDRLSEVCKSIRGGIDQIIRRGRDVASIEVVFKSGGTKYKYKLDFSVSNAEAFVNAESLEVATRDNIWRNLFDTDALTSHAISNQIIARFDKDRPGPRKGISLRRDITVLSQVQGQNVLKIIKDGAKAALESFANIYVLDPTPGRMRDYVQLSETLNSDGSNVAGVIAAISEDESRNFETILTKYVSKLPEKDIRKIWAERVGRFKDTAMLYCREDWGDAEDSMEIDARSMSDGTLRFIAIIVALLTRTSDSLIVIEEIDNGLHPSRAGELVYALTEIAKNGDFDVLCTTHNPVLIDELSTEVLDSVSCVTREGSHGSATIFRLTNRPNFLRELARYTPGNMMTKNILTS
ncbi:MAG: AAA family ATPase [Muribaculaceae bacterium]|nr:AAA family ATPase [Muribaculaceae bacterium]